MSHLYPAHTKGREHQDIAFSRTRGLRFRLTVFTRAVPRRRWRVEHGLKGKGFSLGVFGFQSLEGVVVHDLETFRTERLSQATTVSRNWVDVPVGGLEGARRRCQRKPYLWWKKKRTGVEKARRREVKEEEERDGSTVAQQSLVIRRPAKDTE